MISLFSDLKADELKVLPPELTLFLFPMGGLEQHGPHLPFGTKLIQAEWFTSGIAKSLSGRLPAWNFILMPLLPFSVDTMTNHFSLNVRPHVVRDVIVDQCEELNRLGFQNFAVVSSHFTPKQLTALEDAAKIVSRRKWFGGTRAQLISVSGALIDSKLVWESPMIALPKEHGGARDTGLLLKWKPGHVSSHYQDLPEVVRPKASVSRFMAYLNHQIDGYWGNPAEAKAEFAEVDFNREIEVVTEKMVPWLEQNKGQSFFQSGYRYFPINGSFFKAYLLASLFFVVMLIWVIWGVKDAFEG